MLDAINDRNFRKPSEIFAHVTEPIVVEIETSDGLRERPAEQEDWLADEIAALIDESQLPPDIVVDKSWAKLA